MANIIVQDRIKAIQSDATVGSALIVFSC